MTIHALSGPYVLAIAHPETTPSYKDEFVVTSGMRFVNVLVWSESVKHFLFLRIYRH